MTYSVEVVVCLKAAVNDPQGLVVRDGLRHLGFATVSSVRVGKHIEVELAAADEESARDQVVGMCERLLRNPVIEEYRISGTRAVPD
ncbi:MAG: phosphoribosylformylglycinamidine synthase subunit PurS [Candidatus Dormibacteria bacterium]